VAMRWDTPVPYDELDPPIRALCRAINAFPGLRTRESCSGHRDPHANQLAQGSWEVTLDVRRDDDGWFALEFLAYVINNACQQSGRAVFLYPFAAPPYLNVPGQTLFFALTSESMDPDVLATYLTQRHAADYRGPAAARRR
jgi:hypothetical protein